LKIKDIIEVLNEQGWKLLGQHLKLVGISLLLSIIIALILGIAVTRFPLKKWLPQVVSFLNTAQGVPSLAVVAIFLPIMGIGVFPAIVALTLYGLLPIARNTIAGIEGIDPDILEAARGTGMPAGQIFRKVEIPLALPVIIAGIQTSAVLIVGTAAIAQLIGAGGLGRLIFMGISSYKPHITFLGSLMAAIIAIALDQGIGFIQRRLTSAYRD
jgi:osmoprotectant transport system permease protein